VPTGTGVPSKSLKRLFGRTASISQDIRNQQRGENIEFYHYPCFYFSDIVGNAFYMDTARFRYYEEPIYGPWSVKLLGKDHLFVPFDTSRTPRGIEFHPQRFFTAQRGYRPSPEELYSQENHCLHINFGLYFFESFTSTRAYWYPWYENTSYVKATEFVGFHCYADEVIGEDAPHRHYPAIIEFDVGYFPGYWAFNLKNFDIIGAGGGWRHVIFMWRLELPATESHDIKPFHPFTKVIKVKEGLDEP